MPVNSFANLPSAWSPALSFYRVIRRRAAYRTAKLQRSPAERSPAMRFSDDGPNQGGSNSHAPPDFPISWREKGKVTRAQGRLPAPAQRISTCHQKLGKSKQLLKHLRDTLSSERTELPRSVESDAQLTLLRCSSAIPKWMKLLQQELSSPPQMQTLATSNSSFWIATKANFSQHNTSQSKRTNFKLASRLLFTFGAARGDVRVEHSPAIYLPHHSAFTELVPEHAFSLQTSDKSRTLALTVEKSLGMRLPGAGETCF